MNAQVVIITDAVVARGQAAWSRIKATSAEQRELWLDVGRALVEGRKRYPGKANDRAFGAWCKDQGFADLDRRDRAAAMKWADVSHRVTHPIPSGLSHPRRLIEWFEEQEQEASLPPDLQTVKATKAETVELDRRSAERIAKTIHRARYGGEGSETARRHVEAIAKQHRTSPDKLEEAVAIAAPHAYFRFTPEQQKYVSQLGTSITVVKAMLLCAGFTREAIASLLINHANEIRKGN